MSNANNKNCFNCNKIGCYGVRYRMQDANDRKYHLHKIEPACQWCNASLKVVNKWAWLEYSSMIMLLAPLVTMEFFPDLESQYLIAMIAFPLLFIAWSKLGVRYEFAHYSKQKAQQEKEASDNEERQRNGVTQ